MESSHNLPCKLEEYTILKEIGQGSFGRVCVVTDPQGKCHAMKSIDNINDIVLEEIQKEVKAMMDVKSLYTLDIEHDFYDDFENSYCILTPFYEKGDLRKNMQNNSIKWTENELIRFIAQVTAAFLKLREKNIIHRDLKPENILVTSEKIYKVADFGCSKFIESNTSAFLKSSKPVGTQLYNSPEVSIDKPYNATTDVWSLGVIIYQIIYKKYPIEKAPADPVYVYESLLKVADGKIPIQFPEAPEYSSKFINLLKGMLVVQPEMRLKWIQVQQYLHTNYDNLIHDVRHIVEHSAAHVKILCHMIELLNRKPNYEAIQAMGGDLKKLSTLKNCLILLQYDELESLEKALLQMQEISGVVIMPHVYLEFNRQKPKDFVQRMHKNKSFRDLLPDKFDIEKLRSKVEVLGKELMGILAKSGGKGDLKVALTIAELLASYRKSFRLSNKTELSQLVVKFRKEVEI